MQKFNYFHGGEAEQFSFFRIPRTLISDERFHGLSTEAKLLYGLVLDRMGLSLRSGWLDEEDCVFIFYTLQEVQETLRCGHNKATRLLRAGTVWPDRARQAGTGQARENLCEKLCRRRIAGAGRERQSRPQDIGKIDL